MEFYIRFNALILFIHLLYFANSKEKRKRKKRKKRSSLARTKTPSSLLNFSFSFSPNLNLSRCPHWTFYFTAALAGDSRMSEYTERALRCVMLGGRFSSSRQFAYTRSYLAYCTPICGGRVRVVSLVVRVVFTPFLCSRIRNSLTATHP